MGTHTSALRLKSDGSLITRSGRAASQNPGELGALIELFQRENVTRYLEIGARHGDTFFDVMRSLPAGSKGVAVDLPGSNWGTRSSEKSLRECGVELIKLGYDVKIHFVDSQVKASAMMIESYGPYDAALIDGDHLYEGVKKDWDLYRKMANIVAFHDIAGEGQRQKHSQLPVEVPRLWREIKGDHRHVEFVDDGSAMGIGVVWLK